MPYQEQVRLGFVNVAHYRLTSSKKTLVPLPTPFPPSPWLFPLSWPSSVPNSAFRTLLSSIPDESWQHFAFPSLAAADVAIAAKTPTEKEGETRTFFGG